mmetsp:Transcript_21560/g.25311  ORF Transcript_21560/g.25311 Transcript_21560/m.25311 type:complete len:107 (-) Transcript_21560:64-384(-)
MGGIGADGYKLGDAYIFDDESKRETLVIRNPPEEADQKLQDEEEKKEEEEESIPLGTIRFCCKSQAVRDGDSNASIALVKPDGYGSCFIRFIQKTNEESGKKTASI